MVQNSLFGTGSAMQLLSFINIKPQVTSYVTDVLRGIFKGNTSFLLVSAILKNCIITIKKVLISLVYIFLDVHKLDRGQRDNLDMYLVIKESTRTILFFSDSELIQLKEYFLIPSH